MQVIARSISRPERVCQNVDFEELMKILSVDYIESRMSVELGDSELSCIELQDEFVTHQYRFLQATSAIVCDL